MHYPLLYPVPRSRRIAALAAKCAVLIFPVVLLSACPGDGQRDILVDGVERTYFVSVPESYDGLTPAPLLLAFHGAFRSASAFRRDIALDDSAERDGFITVYPQAQGAVWHSVDEVPSEADDLSFVTAVLDALEDEFAIDTDHIYATGLSLGGLLTYRLAVAMPDRIAGIAPVASGSMPESLQSACEDLRPMPFLTIHGNEDKSLPYTGRQVAGRIMQPFPLLPVEDTFQIFADNLASWTRFERGYMPDRDPSDGTMTRTLQYVDCNGAAVVALYTVEGGGHTWPGSAREQPLRAGRTSHDYNASDVIVDFFAQFLPSQE